MFIKYSPCESNRDSMIRRIGEGVIQIDFETYEFDRESIRWPDIAAQTNGAIVGAYRDENGVLYVTAVRHYTKACPWDSAIFEELL